MNINGYTVTRLDNLRYEQYTVHKNGKQCGFLSLRERVLKVYKPNMSGEVIGKITTHGKSEFLQYERLEHLSTAINHLQNLRGVQ